MKTLIKYLLIAFILFVAYTNRDSIVAWWNEDGQELAEDVGVAMVEGSEVVVEKVKDLAK